MQEYTSDGHMVKYPGIGLCSVHVYGALSELYARVSGVGRHMVRVCLRVGHTPK